MLNLLASMDLTAFQNDYVAARQKFQQSLAEFDPKLMVEKFEYVHPLPGPKGEKLACEGVFLGQSRLPKEVLVVIAGTHGVEGFTGSAIQVDALPLLQEVLKSQPSLGVVLIHAMNPWGFAWVRRGDHQGIDLNRNFIDFTAPLPPNQDYESFQNLLHDSRWINAEDFSDLWRNVPFNDFVEQITRGQYQDPEGLFYGGTAPSWSRQVLEKITRNFFFETAEKICVIDCHTGLGPYGYGEAINDHLPNTPSFKWVEKLYGANACSAHLGESCSPPKLGLLDYHWYEVMGDRGCFITLEYGTYPVDKLISELLREQIYQNTLAKGQVRDIDAKPVQLMKDFFYPQEVSWQQQVLFRSRQMIGLAIEGMLAND